MSNATIRDVAREAAVSVASVSRVINGHANVRPEMRERVEAAVRSLGYAPHAGARNLSMARTHTIGVVLPDLHGEFFSEFVRGMDREASEQGFQLLLSNMHADSDQGMAALQNMHGRVDGLVVMAPHIAPDRLSARLPAGLPVILVNAASLALPRPAIRIDNESGAAAMVDHLQSLGHRTIVHLSGPQDNLEARERQRGYEAAMDRHGLAHRSIQGDFFEESGIAAAQAILDGADRPDALFAANDMMAIGALTTFRRAGLSVPGDIAIAGFDDIPLARLITPGLTTMSVDIAAIGARALERLSAIIAGEADDRTESAAPRLVIRETTGTAMPMATPPQPTILVTSKTGTP